MPSKKTFLEYLVERGLVDQKRAEQIASDAERVGRPVEDLLRESDLIQESALLSAKAEYLNIPYRVVKEEEITPRILRQIPEEAARTYEIAPLALEGSYLDVGMLNPEDVKAEEALRFISIKSGFVIRKYIISSVDFQKILKRYRTLSEEMKSALTELHKELGETTKRVSAKRRTAPEILEEEAPITKMVAVILKHAAEGRASDIHIEPTRKDLRVRFRVDGILYTSLMLPKEVHPSVLSRIKILSDLKIDETRIPQDGRFRADMDGKEIDFRVSTFPTVNGEKAMLRLLDPSIGLKTLPELGISGRTLSSIESAIRQPFGIMLATGPTGSGKSTTLYSLLKILNREAVNIVSLEDPVEYFIEGVNQSQVHEEIGYTFASGLRHILRGDPNIIMVGEIRDQETAKLAIHAGLTGHLVLSTLHTNNAIGVIPRLIDMGVEPFLIPPTLVVAMAQRLVQRLCPDCKKAIPASAPAQQFIENVLREFPDEERKKLPHKPPYTLFQAHGCSRCGRKGRKGRIAIVEALAMTKELEAIILHEASESAILQEAKRQGMIGMLQDGVIKALEGTVALEDIVRVVEEKEIQFS